MGERGEKIAQNVMLRLTFVQLNIIFGTTINVNSITTQRQHNLNNKTYCQNNRTNLSQKKKKKTVPIKYRNIPKA